MRRVKRDGRDEGSRGERLKKAAKEDEDEKEDGMNYLCRVWESARAGGRLDLGRLGLDADV